MIFKPAWMHYVEYCEENNITIKLDSENNKNVLAMANNLYHLQTNELGDYYVIAENPYEAEKTLIGMFEKSDYGFYDSRKVEVIKNLASELTEFPEGKPNFSSGNNLIICKITGNK